MMMKSYSYLNWLVGWLLTSWLLVPWLEAAPLITSQGRFALNWTQMKIRYYGIGDEGDFSQSRQASWDEGMRYLMSQHSEILKTFVISDKYEMDSLQAAQSVSSSSYRIKTTFYPNGMVMTDMESRLPLIFPLSDASAFLQSQAKVSRSQPFLLLQLDKPWAPRPIFQVVTESGVVVYSTAHITQQAFRRNTMARWLKEPAETKQPTDLVKVKAKVRGTHLEVASLAWQKATQGHQSLLAHALVLVAVP